METKQKPLQHLYSLCYRAHTGTSFSPEKRAQQYIDAYSEMLEKDLQELGDHPGNYAEKFISKFNSWMNARCNCISSMIAGPSNFPVNRARKANNAADAREREFFDWRIRYFAAVNRVPTKSPEDELEIATKRLEELTNYQLAAKAINADIRKMETQNRKSGKENDLKEIISMLTEKEYDPDLIKELTEWRGRWSIPAYRLTNNNAKIKATQDKIKIMNTRIERKSTWEDIQFEGGYVAIEDDRLKVFHESKPSQEVINELKSSGYRWSPHSGCWCRKHTGNAIYGLKYLSFLKEQTPD